MKSRNSLIRLKRFQVDEKRRQVMQIEMMIAEFERMASELDEQILAEQKRSGITDVAHFAYPTFAKAAMGRRDNLIGSANDLRGQLDAAQAALSEAVEEVRSGRRRAGCARRSGVAPLLPRQLIRTVGGFFIAPDRFWAGMLRWRVRRFLWDALV
ncbi:MAG: flagellar FliJ protein [Proteobacteria bacterium]|nr:flagellar FliJ protein [Pseudomonadota bacterium]